MRKWIAWTVLSVLLLPLFAGSAWALLDPSGPIQRAQIIANQITQIANQITQIATLDGQLTELQDQLQHMKDATVGQVQALTQPFTQLSSEATGLVSDGMSWKSHFSGVPGELAAALTQMGDEGTSLTTTSTAWLQQADTVSDADITDFFSGGDQDLADAGLHSWEKSRERADKTVVMNQALADAAAELAKALKEAQDALGGLQNQTNMSDTALAQAQLAGAVTTGNLAIAQAQLQTYQAAKEAMQALEDERHRRSMIGAWVADQRAAQTALQVRIAGIEAGRDAMRDRMVLRVHPFYQGQSQPAQ